MEITDFYSKASLDKNINDFQLLAKQNKTENKNKIKEDEKSNENPDIKIQTNLDLNENKIILNQESKNKLNTNEEIKIMIKHIIKIYDTFNKKQI